MHRRCRRMPQETESRTNELSTNEEGTHEGIKLDNRNLSKIEFSLQVLHLIVRYIFLIW